MDSWPEHIRATTTHSRGGDLSRSFTYSIDYVLIDPDAQRGPLLFSRNRFNLASVHDRSHGGPQGKGAGDAWARRVFAEAGLTDYDLRLLTQPRFLGYIFNPVSFWLAMKGDDLLAVIAEVSNPFGDRHSYLCHNPNFEPITPESTLCAEKNMHVSPYLEVSGDYSFNFNVLDNSILIKILLTQGNQTLFANLRGTRAPLTNRAILWAALRRPFGPLRTVALIYWQALLLKLRGATYRTRPAPPEKEITR
ncbi:hypothetical protein SAMN04488044_3275 [Cognatishimia maritima]|uniref:Cyclopropane-fatty-acyl-phospholipid synthase n=2 Tax=Cognatishimia maritima TaxID=870908 RepID=A0A1M5VV11_9RHOB|nr:hypothetical protein SAMN04488044_3275 [Cognatishimia maritima]